MAKTKTPFFGLGAQGSVGGSLTAQKRNSTTLLREKPLPTDPRTDRQIWHRHLYRVACQYWNGLSLAEKQVWKTDGSRYNTTGLSRFLKENLLFFSRLTIYYPLDEASGTIAYDFSGGLLHGAVHGALYVPGNFYTALDFDGIDDYVDCGNSPRLEMGTKDWTIEVRIKTDITSRQGILGTHKDGKGYYLDVLANGKIRWAIHHDNWIYVYRDSLIAINDDLWHHIAVTRTAQTLHIYIDGSLSEDTPGSLDTASNIVSGDNLKLGFTHTGAYYEDLIDELKMNAEVLTGDRILLHSNRKETP